MIAQYCSDLHGLNLDSIPAEEIESHIELWEILSIMYLTHLSIEVCAFQPFAYCDEYEQRLIMCFQKFSDLQALQLHAYYVCDLCKVCYASEIKWSLLSNFPALRYCKLCTDDSNAIQDITTAYKELVCFYCDSWKQLLLTSIHHPKLEQLCIDSVRIVIPNIFMDTILFHGRLLHVFMHVHSVTAEGIISLIANSPGLLTLIIVAYQHVYNEQNVRVYAKDIRVTVKKTFPHRKLFSVGDFRLLRENYKDSPWHLDNFVYDTDLLPLWL